METTTHLVIFMIQIVLMKIVIDGDITIITTRTAKDHVNITAVRIAKTEIIVHVVTTMMNTTKRNIRTLLEKIIHQ